ncbi:MAG: NAD(P)H-dependent oxidoreductase subunit E [Anaerolineaceae bacterium]
MKGIIDRVPTNDPLNNPEQKKIIDEILEKNKDLPGATMVVLNELQSQIGFVSETMQDYVSKVMQVPVSQIHGVISFYSFFTTKPRGRHTVKFCMGTACYVGGTQQLIDKAKQVLGVEPGDTTDDGAITVEVCRCVGACSQAPVIVIDEEIYGRVRPNKLPKILSDVQEADKQAVQ